MHAWLLSGWGDSGFYLAGGTALALQINHRRSNDLAYFTGLDRLDQTLTRGILKQIEEDFGHCDIVVHEPGQLDLAVGQMRRKVSFIAYPFPTIRPEICEPPRPHGRGFCHYPLGWSYLTSPSSRHRDQLVWPRGTSG